MKPSPSDTTFTVNIRSGRVMLEGELGMPCVPGGLVIFAHGSGSSRLSPRNQYVARVIRESAFATLLFDLLTPEEEAVDVYTRHLRFDIELLTRRLIDATNWAAVQPETRKLRSGYFGASTGAAAALVAAAQLGDAIGAVVSRGGRPDLAGDALGRVESPTLLIVGGLDHVVIRLNAQAFEQLRCQKETRIVPGATHLFEEPGALEEVARLSVEWFRRHLTTHSTSRAHSQAREGGT